MNTEYGFYHPDRGYWQTTNEPSMDTLKGYPKGTVQVPLRPNQPDMYWVDGEWKYVPAPVVITSADVDAERDRRIASGFTHRGKRYQTDAFSERSVHTMMTVASAYLLGNGDGESYRWFNPNYDFYFIAEDNTHVLMTAKDMIEFGTTFAQWGSMHTLVGSELKRQEVIPVNYKDNNYWPIG